MIVRAAPDQLKLVKAGTLQTGRGIEGATNRGFGWIEGKSGYRRCWIKAGSLDRQTAMKRGIVQPDVNDIDRSVTAGSDGWSKGGGLLRRKLKRIPPRIRFHIENHGKRAVRGIDRGEYDLIASLDCD